MQAAPVEIQQTHVYASWFAGLRDLRVRARINARIRNLSLGNLDDVKPLGKVCPTHGSTTVPITASTSPSVGRR